MSFCGTSQPHSSVGSWEDDQRGTEQHSWKQNSMASSYANAEFALTHAHPPQTVQINSELLLCDLEKVIILSWLARVRARTGVKWYFIWIDREPEIFPVHTENKNPQPKGATVDFGFVILYPGRRGAGGSLEEL